MKLFMKTKKVSLVVLFLFAVFLLVGCGPKEFTVKFVDFDESNIDIQIVKKGEFAKLPSEPERDYYRFAGWYVEEGKFDIENPITEETVVTAMWIEGTKIEKIQDHIRIKGEPEVSDSHGKGHSYSKASTDYGYTFSIYENNELTLFGMYKGTAVLMTFDLNKSFTLHSLYLVYNDYSGWDDNALLTKNGTIVLFDVSTFPSYMKSSGEEYAETFADLVLSSFEAFLEDINVKFGPA